MQRSLLISLLEEELAQAPPDLIAAYLYGSAARGEQREESDVDLGLLYRSEPPRTLAAPPRQLEDRLTARLGRDVQVVVMNAAPPDLVHRILRDGVLCLDRERSQRIRFEVRSRNEYFDLLPFLERYRRASGARP